MWITFAMALLFAGARRFFLAHRVASTSKHILHPFPQLPATLEICQMTHVPPLIFQYAWVEKE